MKIYLYLTFLALIVLTSSCATLLNAPTTTVEIQSFEAEHIIYQRDTLALQGGLIRLKVRRGPSPLQLFILEDSLSTEARIPAKNSLAYGLNLLYTVGFGLWWERNSLKRYAYPKKIFLERKEEELIWRRFNPIGKKGDAYLQVSLPYLNHFYFQPDGEPDAKSNAGFLGFSVGMDYYFQDQQFCQLTLGAAMDFPLPFPAPIDFVGENESLTTVYAQLSHQFHLNRWKFGYGLSVAQDTWRLTTGLDIGTPPSTRDPVTKSEWMLGAVLPIHYQINGSFHLGLQYRPSLLRIENDFNWSYEHMTSLELAWKFQL